MYFPSSRGCLIALLMALPLSTSVSVITSLFQILITTLLLPSEKDPYVYTGSIWIIQENLPTQNPELNHIRRVPLAMKGDTFTGCKKQDLDLSWEVNCKGQWETSLSGLPWWLRK